MTDTTPAAVEQFSAMLDAWECCKNHGGVGCHPPSCGECPRDIAAAIRALSAQLTAANQLAETARAEGKAVGLREAMDVARKGFPVLGSRGTLIDYQLVLDHAEQAYKNHYQSVGELAQRGGLCWAELYAVLHDKPFAKMDQNDAIVVCRAVEARYLEALIPADTPAPAKVTGQDSFSDLVSAARAEAEKAMRKFPQPNYVLLKVAEEAGEVVKACVHFAEGRETRENVEGEMRQTIAMLYRLWVEGDEVNGVRAIAGGRDE
jgi:hypothetical protein